MPFASERFPLIKLPTSFSHSSSVSVSSISLSSPFITGLMVTGLCIDGNWMDADLDLVLSHC